MCETIVFEKKNKKAAMFAKVQLCGRNGGTIISVQIGAEIISVQIGAEIISAPIWTEILDVVCFLRIPTVGMVQAWVGQKLVKRNI